MNHDFYRAFEDKYRGSRELITSRLRVYTPFLDALLSLDPDSRAIDLGCGRGEWLELLQHAGFKARGVDLDEGMLKACVERGLDVTLTDAISALESLPDGSQSVVSGFHIAEHLEFGVLQAMIRHSLRVLKPGGLLILETPNPENLVVGACNFYLDPTHERPIPTQLLSFLAEYSGFAQVKVLRLQEESRLAQGAPVSLFDVLGGVSPDYAVVAQKSAGPEILAATQPAFDRDYGIGLDQLANRHEQQTAQIAHQVDSSAARIGVLESQVQAAEQRAQAAAQQVEQMSSAAQSTQNALHAAEQKLVALENLMRAAQARAERTISWRAKSFAKNRVLRPLVIRANRSLQPHAHLRHTIGAWLHERFPTAHDRLLSVIRSNSPSSNLSSTWADTAAPLHEPSALHPVLSDRNLLSLERPVALEELLMQRGRTPSSTVLEAVVELDQMRQSPAPVCFVVPLGSHDREALERTMQSVLRQTDPSWEVLLSTTDELRDLASEWQDIDWRIRVTASQAGSNAVRQLRDAALHATSKFVGLLLQGDMIDDDLVKTLGEKLRTSPETDVVYTDEARRLSNDQVGHHFYKPDWSPEHQHSVNMVGRFVAMAKSLLLSAPESALTDDEAAEYQLVLDVTSRARKVAHIDDVMYFRAGEPSVRVGGFFSPAALEQSREALEQHVQGLCKEAAVQANPELGSLDVLWPLPALPVTLLILTGMHERDIAGKGKVVLATNFVRSILSQSSFKDYELIVVDDGFVPADLQALLNQHGHRSVTHQRTGPFSFAAKANFATALVESGIAILLNDDLEVISPDWIQALTRQAARPEVGAVGGRLLFADNTLQHAGIGLGFHGSAGHMFHRELANGEEYGGFASVVRNYSAVTGAVIAYRKDVFDAVGGFDEQFSTDYNDLDFCLKCIDLGYRVVYTPNATLYHFHNSSLKRTSDTGDERAAFLDRWKHVVARDPFFSKHFQTESHDLPPVGASS